jgi:hypothetical protein
MKPRAKVAAVFEKNGGSQIGAGAQRRREVNTSPGKKQCRAETGLRRKSRTRKNGESAMIQYALVILAIAAATVYLFYQLLKRRRTTSCCCDATEDCRECIKKNEAARQETDRD